MSKIKAFILGSIDELQHKVTWPTYDQLQSSSKLVLVASFVFAVVIGLIDLVFKNAVSWFYNNF
ncbi:MAG: preprotein translocase subunit SecE [Bacteroidota bacterium]